MGGLRLSASAIRRMAVVGFMTGFVVLGAHLAWVTWFNGRILPGVVVGDASVGGDTLSQARQAIEAQAAGFRIRLDAAGTMYEETASSLGVNYDVESSLSAAYDSGRMSWLPLQHALIPLSYEIDQQQLNNFAEAVAEKAGTPPVDAAITVSGSSVETIPSKSGWSIDRLGLEHTVEADLQFPGQTVLTLKPQVQLADIQQNNLGPSVSEAQKLMAISIVLNYNGTTIQPTPAQIGGWLDFIKQASGVQYTLTPQVDTSKLKGYVQGLANRLNLAPVPQKESVQDGAIQIYQQGQNGTAIDQDGLVTAISDAITNQQSLDYTITSSVVQFPTMSNTFNPLSYPQYIEVDLTLQHLWVWQNGQIIYDSPVTSGATGAGFGTVTGLFHIYYKTTNTHLVGYAYGPAYNYDVAVQYWMPFYEGFGLHDASWRNGNFGETSGPYGYWYDGSHGCINLPLATAAFLYNWSSVGTPVWVHN